jgi:hypothetical protein
VNRSDSPVSDARLGSAVPVQFGPSFTSPVEGQRRLADAQKLPSTLPDTERDRIRARLCSPRFCDLAPAQVVAPVGASTTAPCQFPSRASVIEVLRRPGESALRSGVGVEHQAGRGEAGVGRRRVNNAWSSAAVTSGVAFDVDTLQPRIRRE